jgi:hypothetical protein
LRLKIEQEAAVGSDAGGCFYVPVIAVFFRHCERSEAIHLSASAAAQWIASLRSQ